MKLFGNVCIVLIVWYLLWGLLSSIAMLLVMLYYQIRFSYIYEQTGRRQKVKPEYSYINDRMDRQMWGIERILRIITLIIALIIAIQQ